MTIVLARPDYDLISKAAKALLDTLSDDQCEAFEAESLGGLFRDVVSGLTIIRECGDDTEKAARTLRRLMDGLLPHQVTIFPLLTPLQREGFVALGQVAWSEVN